MSDLLRDRVTEMVRLDFSPGEPATDPNVKPLSDRWNISVGGESVAEIYGAQDAEIRAQQARVIIAAAIPSIVRECATAVRDHMIYTGPGGFDTEKVQRALAATLLNNFGLEDTAVDTEVEVDDVIEAETPTDA